MWGGQVRKEENFEEAPKRQFYKEFGIRIEIIGPIFTYEIIRPNKPKIPGIKFLCRSIDNGKEEVLLNKREFSEYKWITETQCRRLRMITGVQRQIEIAFSHIKDILMPDIKIK